MLQPKHIPRRRQILFWPVLAVLSAVLLPAIGSVDVTVIGYAVAGGLCGGVAALLGCFTVFGRYTLENPLSGIRGVIYIVILVGFVNVVLDHISISDSVLLGFMIGYLLGQTAVLSPVYLRNHDQSASNRAPS